MSKWSDYYKSRIHSIGYIIHCSQKYSDFIKELTLVSKESVIIEEGCGIGTFSKILTLKGYKYLILTDNDPDILKLCHQNMNVRYCSIMWDDATLEQKIPIKADLLFSHGLLEHFDKEDIKLILHNQLRKANRVVHYVPTNKYDSPSFGDERLMPFEWWLENFNPKEYILSNDGKDLTLIWY